MKILLFGSGAREHALYDAILKSQLVKKEDIYFAQTGVFANGNIIDFEDYYNLAKKAHELDIELLIVGPEAPLVDGICDIFLSFGIKTIGANKYWAQLEGSKTFAKDMAR